MLKLNRTKMALPPANYHIIRAEQILAALHPKHLEYPETAEYDAVRWDDMKIPKFASSIPTYDELRENIKTLLINFLRVYISLENYINLGPWLEDLLGLYRNLCTSLIKYIKATLFKYKVDKELKYYIQYFAEEIKTNQRGAATTNKDANDILRSLIKQNLTIPQTTRLYQKLIVSGLCTDLATVISSFAPEPEELTPQLIYAGKPKSCNTDREIQFGACGHAMYRYNQARTRRYYF